MPFLAPPAVARFAEDWHAATGGGDGAALVALSGGGDSVALLLLLAALGPVRAATVDHRLRPASADEAAHAAAICTALGVPHAVLSGALPPRAGRTANVSARARALRYGLLHAHADAVGAAWIATAHHADDQAETLAMRLARGAGLRGLAGVRRRQGRVVRPLLGWRRAELAAIVADAGIAPVVDPSNTDDRYARARWRKALATLDAFDPVAAARSAAALAEAEAAIGWSVAQLVAARCALGDGAARLDPDGLPAEYRRRLVEHCLAHVDPGIAPRGREIGAAIVRLEAGGGGTLGGARYSREGAAWTFAGVPPHRSR